MTPPTPAVSSAEPFAGTIDAIEPRLLPSRLEHGLRAGSLTLERQRLLPVVRCRSGRLFGVGEAPPLPSFTGEDAEQTRCGLERAAPGLLGLSPRDVLELLHAPGAASSSPVRCALDIAMHDLLARARGIPLWRLLGAERRQEVRVSRAIGLHTLEETVRIAAGYLDAGVRALKLKVGRDPAFDARVVLAVREVAGSGLELAADANESYDTASAHAFLTNARRADLAYLEQPLARHDLAGHRALRRAGARILLDESIFDAADVGRVAAAEAADAVAIKLLKCGGLRPALDLAAAAAEQGLPAIVIDPLGSAVSLNAGLHLAAVLDDAPFAHGLGAGLEVTTAYAPHLPVEDGLLALPRTPGLGVEVRWPDAAGPEAEADARGPGDDAEG